MPFSSGDKLGQYEILAPIGAGGMGEVFRARDPRLCREVAIKVLPAAMAHDPERLARFQREARTVAALSHPNIVTIFSVEHADGIHFLTMELVEGLPLDRLIGMDGLPANQIVEIAEALSDALADAHDKGIVHRDLKPANVMVTHDGRVKVLDFGLAKDVGGASPDDETRTSLGNTQAGMVMGTPSYMSPEQISARPLDHRTDIFSLGVVLHEMSTGKKPFTGSSSAELISSILRDTPASISASRPDLPGDLSRIVRRCLEKDPRHRIQTARDVSNEFRDMARQSPQKAAPQIPAQAAASTQAPAPGSHSRTISAADSGAARADEGFWVAVLPFKAQGTSTDLAALADGLSEEIVTGLSRFSYLRVIARSSTSRYAQGGVDVRSVGRELGARYVIEGSLRQAGPKLRLAVQLTDANTGTHLWAETYEHVFTAESVFEVQDHLVPQIVATLADAYGVLPRTMSQALRSRASSELTPYEALLRSFAYLERVTAEEHAHAKAAIESALQRASDSPDCWAMLSILLADECIHGFGCEPDTLDRAVQAARRAVDLGSANHKAWQSLAWAQFARKEFRASRVAAERAISLNPMDASAAGHLGQVIAYSGDWERGCELIAHAVKLNPNHPGWFWYVPFLNAYRKCDYRRALEFAFKMNMPGVPLVFVALAASHGQLGQLEPARAALRELLALKPDYAQIARTELGTLYDSPLVDHIVDGLRKAGLDIADGQKLAPERLPSESGPNLTATTPSIAVLPFANLSAEKDQEYFSDGLAEEIINLLARISGLKVIARTSAFAFRSKEQDIRGIANVLGVTTILQGSVRRAANRIRVTVQLINASDGAHLWSERYDREMTDVFAVQDEIAAAIAGALQVKLSPEAIPKRYEPKIEAYEAYLKAKYQQGKATPESLELAKQYQERAIQLDPAFALARTEVGFYWVAMAMFGRYPSNKASLAARAEAERALQIDPALPDAHALLGYLAAVFELDWTKAEKYFAFPGAKQVGNSITQPLYGWFQYLRGNVAEAIALVERAIEQDPFDVFGTIAIFVAEHTG